MLPPAYTFFVLVSYNNRYRHAVRYRTNRSAHISTIHSPKDGYEYRCSGDIWLPSKGFLRFLDASHQIILPSSSTLFLNSLTFKERGRPYIVLNAFDGFTPWIGTVMGIHIDIVHLGIHFPFFLLVKERGGTQRDVRLIQLSLPV